MMQRGSFMGMMPPVTKNLIIINLIVWLAMFVIPGKAGVDMDALFGLHYFRAADFNPAQLVTYMFMHSTSSFAHIFFNMFSLWMFGTVLERALGGARFLFYYVSCGIGAALVQELAWALTWEDTMMRLVANLNGIDFPEARQIIAQALGSEEGRAVIAQNLNMFVTIGASGAVYGILLAFGMIWPNRPLYLFFIPIPIKAKWMVIGMGVVELLIGMSSARGVSDGVAHFAHMGGMIFGLLIIWYWKRSGAINGGEGYY